jgi:hypothetical protein
MKLILLMQFLGKMLQASIPDLIYETIASTEVGRIELPIFGS